MEFRGFSFPFRVGANEFPVSTSEESLVADSIKQLLITNLGERLMRPTYGIGALGYVFEHNDPLLASNVRSDVARVISKHEPRAQVQSTDVIRDKSSLVVQVFYTVRATNRASAVNVRFDNL